MTAFAARGASTAGRLAAGLRALARGAGLLALGLLVPGARAEPVDVARVHAAYVINFVRYTRWPATVGPGQPYVVAVLGAPGAAATLRQLAHGAGAIDGHAVLVRTLPLNTVAPGRREAVAALQRGLDGIQAVYVAPSHRAWNEAVVAATRGRPVLTIGSGVDFVADGGMFGLVESRGRVGFTANEDAIRHAAVDVSARVLLLARSAD